MIDYAVEIEYPDLVPRDRFGSSTTVDISAPCADIAENNARIALARKMSLHYGFDFTAEAYKTICIKVINS